MFQTHERLVYGGAVIGSLGHWPRIRPTGINWVSIGKLGTNLIALHSDNLHQLVTIYWATGTTQPASTGNWHQWVTIGQLGTTTTAKRLPCIRTTGFNGSLLLLATGRKRSGCLAFGQLASMDNFYWASTWEQLRPRSGCLAFGQLASMDNFYWATGKYGRVAKRLPCFLRVTGIKPIGQLKSGRLAFGQLASMNHVYWATKNNGREAAALRSGNWHQWIIFIGQLGNTVESRSGCLAFFGQLASNLLGN